MTVTNPSTTKTSEKDHWATDPSDVAWLAEYFCSAFGLDPCASHDNAKAGVYFGEYIDGLSVRWSDHASLVFMNPPFSQKLKWYEKAHEEMLRGATTVAVAPVMLCAKWYQFVEETADIILIPNRRIKFLHPETGAIMDRPSFETVFPVWRPGVRGQARYVRIDI